MHTYRETMHAFAAMGTLELWYARIELDEIVAMSSGATAKERKRFEKNLDKTRSKDSMKAFAKLTTVRDGGPRFVNDPPLIVPIDELAGVERRPEVAAYVKRVLSGYGRTLSSDRARSSASAASGPAPGSCCCSGATTATP